MQVIYGENHDFRQIFRFISEMMQDSYYGIRVGNRIQAFAWYNFQ